MEKKGLSAVLIPSSPFCSPSLQLSQKYVVSFHFPARWNKKNSLTLPSSFSTSNPYLKRLSKELKAAERSQAALLKLTLTQEPEMHATYFDVVWVKVAYLCVMYDEFICKCSKSFDLPCFHKFPNAVQQPPKA